MKSKENIPSDSDGIKRERLETSNPNREKIPTSEKDNTYGKITTGSNTRKEIQMYKIHCAKCKKRTKHYVSKTSRKRGVKLTCIKCYTEKNHYLNLRKLEKC